MPLPKIRVDMGLDRKGALGDRFAGIEVGMPEHAD